MIKNKDNYRIYEYIYDAPIYGNVILLAHARKKEDENWLSIWLKTSDDMGFMHFIIGFKIEDDSELTIRRAVEYLTSENAEYLNDAIFLAFEDEGKLEDSLDI